MKVPPDHCLKLPSTRLHAYIPKHIIYNWLRAYRLQTSCFSPVFPKITVNIFFELIVIIITIKWQLIRCS